MACNLSPICKAIIKGQNFSKKWFLLYFYDNNLFTLNFDYF